MLSLSCGLTPSMRCVMGRSPNRAARPKNGDPLRRSADRARGGHLLQIDRFVVSLRVELSAPDLVRALMLRRPEADERAEAHVEVADAFQAIDQLLSVRLGTSAP